MKIAQLASALLVAFVSLAGAQQPAMGRLEGIDSAYTEYLTQVLEHWAPAHAEAPEAGPVAITCLATANADGYVGMLQLAKIHAPLSVVEGVLDDVDHFKDLFPDTVDVHVVPDTQAGARYATAWVQRAAIFFMPDISYEMSHLVDKTTPERVVYRYKLRRGDRLIASDGMVVLEATGPATTQFTEYDFFNGHWDLIPTWIVWRESLRGAFHSDLAIKLKAENPTWSYARIAAEAKRLTSAQSDRLQRCFAERHTAPRQADEPKGTALRHEARTQPPDR
jgi:hypothetical protein